MVTPHQLNSWRPAELAAIADAVASHRSALTRQSDELDDGKPPASWTFADGDAARVEHDRLATALAIQVSETFGVASALDAAEASIRSAQEDLTGALRRASWNDLSVDMTSGAVSITRDYEDPEDLEYAQTVAAEVADQIAGAVQVAQAADDALAAALTVASATDVNAMGNLDAQREITDFEGLSAADQAALLLEHPEKFAVLDDYASPEAKERLGEAIGAELDAVARDATALGDQETVERCSALLTVFGDDPAVMASMYERLEPEGLLATFGGVTSMMYIGSNVEELAVLADELRSGLQVASQDPAFAGEAYGRELARYATHDVTDAERDALYDTYGTDGNGNAGVLDYLLREGDYGESFVRGVAWQMDEFERTSPGIGEQWAHFDSLLCPLNGLDGAPWDYQPDPMASVMGQLGEHPELGLEFFTATDEGQARSDFYFAERDWSRDGFEGISEMALAVGTDPDNLANSRYDTSMFVSEYFDRLPDNPEFNAENAAGAAEPVADLLKHYMPSFETAVCFGTEDAVAGVDDETGYPTLDRADVDGLLDVALSTEDGMARIAEGIGGYRNEQLMGYAERNPGYLVPDAHNGELNTILQRSATLEGYVNSRVASIDIAGAVSKDQQVATFADLVSEGIKLGGKVVPGAGLIAAPLAEFTKEQITEAFGNNADATRDQAISRAQAGEGYVEMRTLQSLADAGLIDLPDSLRDDWMPDGVLIEPDDPQFAGVRRDTNDLLAANLEAWAIGDAYQDPFVPWVAPEDQKDEE